MQTKYDFAPDVGLPGGLYDLTDYVCDSYNNEEADGNFKFGMGVVKGTTNKKAKLPSSASAIGDFFGVLMNGLTTEHTMDGDVCVLKGNTLGVLKRGRIWARIAAGAVPDHGKAALLVTSGDECGCFTTTDDEDNEGKTIAINAMFLDGNGSGDVAPMEVYPTVIVAPAAAASGASESDPEQQDNG